MLLVEILNKYWWSERLIRDLRAIWRLKREHWQTVGWAESARFYDQKQTDGIVRINIQE